MCEGKDQIGRPDSDNRTGYDEPVIQPPVFSLEDDLIILRSLNTTTGRAIDDVLFRAAARTGINWHFPEDEEVIDTNENRNIFKIVKEHGDVVLGALRSLLDGRRQELVREELVRITENDEGMKSYTFVENPNNGHPVTKADVAEQMVIELTMILEDNRVSIT